MTCTVVEFWDGRSKLVFQSSNIRHRTKFLLPNLPSKLATVIRYDTGKSDSEFIHMIVRWSQGFRVRFSYIIIVNNHCILVEVLWLFVRRHFVRRQFVRDSSSGSHFILRHFVRLHFVPRILRPATLRPVDAGLVLKHASNEKQMTQPNPTQPNPTKPNQPNPTQPSPTQPNPT